MWIIELEMRLFKLANDINIQMKYDTACIMHSAWTGSS